MADDDNLELKKRARRRLVGAAALALLAAIVLPMVMDQEPRPLNQDVQIQIPRQEGDNFTAHPIAPRGEVSTPAVVANPDTPAEPESPGSTPVVRPAPLPAPVAGQEAAKPEAPKPEPPKAEPAKPEAPRPEVPKSTPPKAEAGRAEAILAGQEESYVVQLGAYKDEANVMSLRTKLKGEGFSTYTEKVADKTRVRVGPYPSREAAEKAAGKLRELGLNGVVTVR